jgi:protein TonB
MTQKMLTATLILMIAVFGAARGQAQSNQSAQAAASAPSPTPASKIVTKDPEYVKLLNPPQGNVFLQTYSKSYRDKAAEIEAKVGGINDENLQNEARNAEWVAAHEIDGDKFMYEAETALREAKISFSQKHRDGWFEIGRVAYDENNSVLAVLPNSATPIDAALRAPVKVATLNQVYAKFHDIAAQEIDQKAHEYVAKSAAGSTCSKNPDLCFGYAKKDIEQTLRSERMFVVAQGDLQTCKIDRLLLVDYDTEAVLLELDDHVQGLSRASWRFSIGPAPSAPAESVAAEAQVQPAADASPGIGPSPAQNTQDAKNGNKSGAGAEGSTSAKASTARANVPANVTALSIISQTAPEYPPQARAARIQGEVILHALVDKEGKISELHVLSGDDTLAQSALQAVRQWRYKPMLVDGQPKEADATITVTFSLDE